MFIYLDAHMNVHTSKYSSKLSSKCSFAHIFVPYSSDVPMFIYCWVRVEVVVILTTNPGGIWWVGGW